MCNSRKEGYNLRKRFLFSCKVKKDDSLGYIIVDIVVDALLLALKIFYII